MAKTIPGIALPDGAHALKNYVCPLCDRSSHNFFDISHKYCTCCGSKDLPKSACPHRKAAGVSGKPHVKLRAIVGLRSDHKEGPVYAYEADGRLQFTALIRANRPTGFIVRVDAPVWAASQVKALVVRRMKEFGDHHGARESPQAAVIRKSIAAQGQSTVSAARRQMSKMQQMELSMMLSHDSHSSALPYDEGEGRPTIWVSDDGAVTGLPITALIDQQDQRYKAT